MESQTRILERQPDKVGYKMSGVEQWKGFIATAHGEMLSHDLYHHREGEKGFHWEETRALGARLYYEPIGERRLPPADVIRSVNRLVLNENFPSMPVLSTAIDLPMDAVKHYEPHCDKVILMLLTSGYQYAKIIGRSIEGYNKIKEISFRRLYGDHRGDLLVDLDTGDIERLPVKIDLAMANFGARGKFSMSYV